MVGDLIRDPVAFRTVPREHAEVACIIPVAAGASVRGGSPDIRCPEISVTWTVRTGTGLTLECRERKITRSASDLRVDMLGMDEPLFNFNELIGTGLCSCQLPVSSSSSIW